MYVRKKKERDKGDGCYIFYVFYVDNKKKYNNYPHSLKYHQHFRSETLEKYKIERF